MIDYAAKKKSVHTVLWILLLVIGVAFIVLAYVDRDSTSDPAKLEFAVFDLKVMVGLVFMLLAGLWRAVIRLSTEVAALEAKVSKTP